MKTELIIGRSPNYYLIPVLDGAEWATEDEGIAGSFTFTIPPVKNLYINEGDIVKFKVNGKKVFAGYVFTLEWDKSGIVKVTAYDSLRYLKSKDTYNFEGKTASEILTQIAVEHQIPLGDITDTKYRIPSMIEDNLSLFDIIFKAMKLTEKAGYGKFILYDDFGKLSLKHETEMVTDVLIDISTAQDFLFTSDINKETYNIIKLAENGESLVVKDENTVREWGDLQYFGTVENGENAQEKAKVLLEMFNKRHKSLTVKGAIGDPSVRGGSIISVKLNLGGEKVDNLMLVKECRHVFNQGYFMRLVLAGYVPPVREEEVKKIVLGNHNSLSQATENHIGKTIAIKVGESYNLYLLKNEVLGYVKQGSGYTPTGKVDWSSHDTDVIKWLGTDLIKAVKIGEAVVIGETSDGAVSVSYTFKVIAPSYTVSYDANGGSYFSLTQTKYHGVSLTLSVSIPQRTGYNFLGWSPDNKAELASYQPGDKFSMDLAITLYAVWVADTGKKVSIEVGHGGDDPGVVHYYNGVLVMEKNITLVVSIELKQQLERHGINVLISRKSDLNDRAKDFFVIAEAYKPSIGISVHVNSTTDEVGTAKGFEAFVRDNDFKTKSELLCKCIEHEVLALGQISRGIISNTFIMSGLSCPTAYCELGFLNNPDDYAQFDTPDKQRAFGVAYAKGILNYLGVKWKP